MSEEVIREGKWRCPGCGNSNRGRDVKCQGCGQARENVEFEYDESAPAVEGEDLEIATGGADWVCAYCSTSNRARLRACGQCGGLCDEGRARDVSDVAPAAPLAAASARSDDSPGVPPALTALGFIVLALAGMLYFAF